MRRVRLSVRSMLIIQSNRGLIRALIIDALFFLFTSVCFAASDSGTPCPSTLLPDSIRHILDEKYATWRPLTLSDLTKVEQNLWLKDHGIEQCPGIAMGHFESEKSLSYAIFLVPKEVLKPGTRFLVIMNLKRSASYSRLTNQPATTSFPKYHQACIGMQSRRRVLNWCGMAFYRGI
jgi:hypothetical protein